jgi:ACT domain-containing protein
VQRYTLGTGSGWRVGLTHPKIRQGGGLLFIHNKQRTQGKPMSSSRFVITVIGLDRVGIVAGITRVMAEYSVNIADIRQTIMNDLFTMLMLAEVKSDNFDLTAFQEAMSAIGKELGVQVIVQHEDAFRFMHRI